MKTLLIGSIIYLASAITAQSCLSGQPKQDGQESEVSGNKIVYDDTTHQEVGVTTSLTSQLPINRHIFGLNIGFSFARELDKDSGFVQLLRDMNPENIRFPGGTVGNYYHPDAPVYGFKLTELLPSLSALYNQQSKRDENILYNFIRLSKLVNTNAVYCANTYTGTDDEIMLVVDALKKNNIPILGVELGNELVGAAYRNKIPNVEAYKTSILGAAKKIKQKYPDIKLSVIASLPVLPSDKSQRAQFMRGWDIALAKEKYADAIVIHEYSDCPPCDKESKTIEEIFYKNTPLIGPEKFNKIAIFKDYYQKAYTPNTKIWLTEWNMANPNFEGTFLQGLFVYEMFLNLLDLNAKHGNTYELTNVHYIGGFVNDQKSANQPLFTNGNNRTTVQYYAFKYLSSTLSQNAVRITDNMEKNPTEGIVVKSFYDKTSKRTLVYFLNRSGKKTTLNLADKVVKNATYTIIETTRPYAAISRTSFEGKNPELNNVPVTEQRNIPVEKNKIEMAPYAFGYISYTN